MLKKEDRVNISEASRILSVSEQALRQWTDEGKIKAFITPGGHRRYSRAELKRFVSENRKMLGMKDLVIDLEQVVSVLHNTATDYLRSTSWRGQMDSESQKNLAALGHRLLELIIKSVSGSASQADTSKDVEEVGADFGRVLARLGLPLTEAAQTFIQHRDPIIKVATEMLKKREGFDRRIIEAIPAVNGAMDEALIALVTAYQQQQGNMGKKKESKQV